MQTAPSTAIRAACIPNGHGRSALCCSTHKDGKVASSSCKVLDGTGTANDVYLNFLIDDTDHNVAGTACNLIVNGTVTLHWVNLGDI